MHVRPFVIAHRGNSSVAPENTMAALEAAWRADADMVEIDLRATSDGVGAVMHDSTLDRTTDGTGPIDQVASADIPVLDAGSWFAPAYAGQRVPLLEDVARFLAAREGIGLLLELKGRWATDGVRRAVETLRRFGLADRVVVQSFDAESLVSVRDVAPELRRALLVTGIRDEQFALCRESGAVACNPPASLLTYQPAILSRIHDEGLQAMAWTSDSPAQWATLVRIGCDAIITNRPDRLTGWLAHGAV